MELLRQQANPVGAAQAQAPANPLLFALIVMSLVISVALVALVAFLLLGATGSSMRHQHPFDK